MGLTLMADDRDLILGEIRGVQSEILKRLDRQDIATDADREQREKDKHEAIKAREKSHAELNDRLKRMDEKATVTYGLASATFRWMEEHGEPAVKWFEEHGRAALTRVDGIDLRVSALETHRNLDAAENKGWVKAWAKIAALGTAAGGALAGAITYGREVVEFFKGVPPNPPMGH